MKCLIVCGVLVHIILLMAAFDIYFVSPILHGMKPYRPKGPPPSKRIVLFVADGLRAQSIFGHNMSRTAPFLKNVIDTSGAWGIAHTQVPTESRPGHVAMLAGFYEDPSAITKGWKANPVDFDSVINQSTNAWCWGSPDIVHLFNRDGLAHISVSSYHSNLQDFSMKSESTKLDHWVFRNANLFFKNHVDRCEKVCDAGNVFFLHLLGVDVAGHSSKPKSKEYVENIAFVDYNIKQFVNVVDGYFKDNLTTYVFTSDHGMTDWGAHGDGSEHETHVPFIAWGAGIEGSVRQQDINQTDIAVLLASVIGINIPVNSMGVVPLNYIKASKEHKTQILLANALQIVEQYHKKRKVIENSTFKMFYKPFELVPQNIIENIVEASKAGEQNKILRIIGLSLTGLKYYNYYHQKPILFFTTLGFLQWMIFVFLNILDNRERIQIRVYSSYLYLALVIKLVVIYCCYAQQFPVFYYIYFIFPLAVFDAFLLNPKTLIILKRIACQKRFILWLLSPGLLYLTGILFLSAAFFNRMALSCLHLYLSGWIFFQKPLRLSLKIRWSLLCIVLAYFPMRQAMQTLFVHEYFYIGAGLWALVFTHLISGNPYVCDRCSLVKRQKAFVIALLLIFVCAVLNVVAIEKSIYNKSGLLVVNQIVSWVLLCQSFVLPLMVQVGEMARLVVNSISLISAYTLFAVDCETIFAATLVYLLFNWILVEYYLRNAENKLICCSIRPSGSSKQSCVRTILFFYVFVVTAMFASGNAASLSSFDPLWVRSFVTVFSPFTMAILIVMKLLIPILLVLCAFCVVIVKIRIAPRDVFLTMTLFSDVMVLIFFFQIRNEGSWKDIGLSLSRFIIAEVMTICLMVLHLVARVLVSYDLCWVIEPCVFKFRSYFEKRCHQL